MTPCQQGQSYPVNVDPADPHIMKWWSPAHDKVLKETILKHRWNWYWHVCDEIVAISDEQALSAWKTSDPICSRWVWSNALMYFAQARAQNLGFLALIPVAKKRKCLICGDDFTESSIPEPLLARLGSEQSDFCKHCLAEAFYSTGSSDASADEILSFPRELIHVLGRTPSSVFGTQRGDLSGMQQSQQFAILELLRRKPSLPRVKQLFGTWKDALRAAEGSLR